MSSGGKEIVVNPLERALSGDVMRGQNFAQAALAEILRGLFDTKVGTDDLDAAALYNPSSTNNPSSGEVLSGLLFAPTGGTTASAVGPGVLGIYDPDAVPSADDSQYKVVQDPGTTSLLTPAIALTANSSGSLRIDVLECARVQPDNVLETDSRDVFNPTTGTFAAAAVNKVTAAQLQYRIRTGTPGSGFPGAVAGWLPLVVFSVPTGTTTWDTVTMWDVRPLVEDRLFSSSPAPRDLPKVTRCYASIDAIIHGGASRLTGEIEAELLGRRVGGALLSSCPQGGGGGVGAAADALYVDLDDAANQSAGGSISASGFNYVYLATPFGLPRWAKYTKGPGGRQPRSPRGLVVASSQTPDLVYGTPDAALVLPPCLQDVGVTQAAATNAAVCVLARIGTSASSTTKGSLAASGGRHYPYRSGRGQIAVNSASVSVGTATWTLNPNVDFPPHARALYLEIVGALTISGGTITNYLVKSGDFNVLNGLGTAVAITDPPGGYSLVGPTGIVLSNSQTFDYRMTVRIPLPSYYEIAGVPGASTPGIGSNYALEWTPVILTSGGGTLALTAALFNVVGWELADAD